MYVNEGAGLRDSWLPTIAIKMVIQMLLWFNISCWQNKATKWHRAMLPSYLIRVRGYASLCQKVAHCGLVVTVHLTCNASSSKAYLGLNSWSELIRFLGQQEFSPILTASYIQKLLILFLLPCKDIFLVWVLMNILKSDIPVLQKERLGEWGLELYFLVKSCYPLILD